MQSAEDVYSKLIYKDYRAHFTDIFAKISSYMKFGHFLGRWLS